jgi:hypothetical protein
LTVSKALTALNERLGVSADTTLPLAQLAEADLARLDLAVAGAMAAEDEAVETGLQEAVRFVPRPLRGRATRLLFPEGTGG